MGGLWNTYIFETLGLCLAVIWIFSKDSNCLVDYISHCVGFSLFFWYRLVFFLIINVDFVLFSNVFNWQFFSFPNEFSTTLALCFFVGTVARWLRFQYTLFQIWKKNLAGTGGICTGCIFLSPLGEWKTTDLYNLFMQVFLQLRIWTDTKGK